VQVLDFDNAAALSAGTRHTAAVRNDGTVWTWGANWDGQLGDGTETSRTTPVQVRGANGAGFLNLSIIPVSTLELNGTRVTKTITPVPGSPNHVDVTLTLAQNAGIYSFLTELVFDDTRLTPVDIANGPVWSNLYASPLVGRRYPNRLRFLNTGVNISHQTGMIATVRFRVDGGTTQPLPIALSYLNLTVCDGVGGMNCISTTAGSGTLSYFGINDYELELSTFSSSTTNNFLWGDVNGDGRVTSADTTHLARYLVLQPVNINRDRADVNMDGLVNTRDLGFLAQALAGFDVTLGPPHHTMTYRIMVNSDGHWGNRIIQAENRVAEVAPGFKNVLNTTLIQGGGSASSSDLNMRGSCPSPEICDWNCGELWDCFNSHHRSSHYLNTKARIDNVNVFRFVGFSLCAYNATQIPQHAPVGGTAQIGGNNMIVALMLSDYAQRVYTAHEISHLLGAECGKCVPDADCPMNYRSFDEWCSNCIRAIANHRR
jgi:hypothetical protein